MFISQNIFRALNNFASSNFPFLHDSSRVSSFEFKISSFELKLSSFELECSNIELKKSS